MMISGLGHVVLQVRSRERAEAFYHGVLGLEIAARYEPMPSTFFTVGSDHHCFAVIEVGEDAALPDPKGAGMRHLAFRLGDAPEALAAIRDELDAAGIEVQKMLDHGITHSIYTMDPDGNVVELYVDVSDAWKRDPSLIVATPRPLKLA